MVLEEQKNPKNKKGGTQTPVREKTICEKEGKMKRFCDSAINVHTSLSIFTLALSPSIASSFWPSRSSAKRVPAKGALSDGALLYPGYGDERPEWGGVGA